MRRIIYNNLLQWKNNSRRQPLIVLGANKIGKTHIIKEFCQKEYKDVVFFDLLRDTSIVDLFKRRLNAEEKYRMLKILIGLEIDIESPETIIFFDEIQESEELISNLKFLNEEYPHVNIICAGSLLGVKLRRFNLSFPVGKVEMINMYPMNFKEFLMTFNEDLLISEIEHSYQENKALISILHEKALLYYRYYLCTGGMPESVLSLVEYKRDISKYNVQILENIAEAYFNDMSKYIINKGESLKISKLYRSIPTQLGNKANKFQYSKIESKARKRDYETAIDWLLASRLLLITYNVSTPQIPLRGFINNDFFKLYMSDVGLLRRMLNLKFSDILLDNISLYKGVIVENYVANELVFNKIELFYWKSKLEAEVDFLLYTSKGIIPIEVKAGDSVKSKSLNVYIKEFKPAYAIRLSTRNFGFVNNIKSVPLYAVFCIKE